MSIQDNTITAQVMNNLDQLYTAHGQGIQPLYSEEIGITPAFTYNNVMSAINNGYLPVYVENNDGYCIYNLISACELATSPTEYRVYLYSRCFLASSPDSYLVLQQGDSGGVIS